MAIEALSAVGTQALGSYRRMGRIGEGGLARPIGRIEALPATRRRGEASPASAPEPAPKKAEPGRGAPDSPPDYDRRSASTLVAPSGEAVAKAPSGDPADSTAARPREGKTGGPSAGKRDKPSERELREDLAKLQAEKAAKDRQRLGSVSARSGEIQRVLSALKARDGEVRAHESAHIAAGGRYITGGASYSYQKGPDGRQYAVGGEVGIDSSPIPGKPEETIAKMRIVRAAALAPAEPSGPDLAVAGAAAQAESIAVAELARQQSEAPSEGGSGGAVAELARSRGEEPPEGGSGGAVAELARQQSEAPSESGSGGAVAEAAGAEAYGRVGREKEAEPGSKLDLVA